MRRRDFIAMIGSAAAAWSAVARAQQPSVPVVGYLGSGSRESDAFRLIPFQQGLKEAGYVENRDVAFEYRWAENQNDRFPALAADLAARHVAVIVALGSIFAVRAAKAVTTTIPIVFEVGVDPVEVGVVTSLNRPGGNATGVTSLNVEIGPKELELLRVLVVPLSGSIRSNSLKSTGLPFA
jgi:putative tryptophan/tyrosine transport system substrate-binding protein